MAPTIGAVRAMMAPSPMRMLMAVRVMVFMVASVGVGWCW
jgi:hypothetical protein